MAHRVLAHQHWTAAGFFALFVVAYLWPALVGGGLLAPVSRMYEFAPWQGLAPQDVSGYLNIALEDVPFSYYPWDVFARSLIHAGTFPAWNPHAFAGTPFFANFELAWLSPFSLPLWLLPLNYGLGLAAALKLWMAGFGAYLLVRELKLGFWPGLLAGVSFALCAFNVVWLSHGVQLSVAALLPWALWLGERIVRRGRSVDALALTGIVTLIGTGGHPGTQLHVISGLVLYVLIRTLASTDVVRTERLRRVGLIVGAMVLGTVVTAVVLLPATEASTNTAGLLARRNGSTLLPGAHMSFEVMRAALFPDWWGRPSDLAAPSPANYNERAFYAGVVALVLAGLALVSTGGWRRKAPFVVLGAIGTAVAVNAPLVRDLVVHLPMFNQVQDQRMLLWLLLAVAVLGAFGLESLIETPRRNAVAGVLVVAVLAGIIASLSLRITGDTWAMAARYMLHRTGPVTLAALGLASIGWWLVFVAALCGAVLIARRRPERRVLIGALVVVIAALDMLHFANGYQPMGSPSKALPPTTPAIAYLQRHTDDGRIAGLQYALTQDWSTVYGLRDVRGYDAPQPSLRFYRLWQSMTPEQAPSTLYSFGGLSTTTLRILGLLGGRYILADPGTQGHASALTRVYRGTDATIFTNRLAMPRATVARHVQIASDEDAEFAGVVSETFDPRHDAVVRADELGGVTLPRSGAGTARVVHERNAAVTLRATLPRRGLVILDDAWAPGWTVQVDGHPAHALQTDVVLRGVVVPAGTHEITWSYRVPGLRLGLMLSLLGLLIMGGWGGWLVVRAHTHGGR